MKFLYFLVTDCKAYADKLDAFKYFFEKEGGFTAAFLVAIGVAFVFALIYYLFCFRSFSWAKTGSWLCTLVVAACVSFAATGYATGMSQKKTAKTGIRHAIELKYQEKVETQAMDISELDSARANIHKGLDKGMFTSPVIFRLCITNFVLTLLLFYIFSICFNGFSKHGVNIPHPGLYRP